MESAVIPFQQLLNEFKVNRANNLYWVNINSQVCHIRGMLNDAFDITERRIKVSNGWTNDWLVLWSSATFNAEKNGVPVFTKKATETTVDGFGNKTLKNDNAVMVYRQGSVGSLGYDFVVEIPVAMQGTIDEERVKAMVNANRLASKRYKITYYE